MMMCGGLALGVQLASGSVFSRSVRAAPESMYPWVIRSKVAATPERENLDT